MPDLLVDTVRRLHREFPHVQLRDLIALVRRCRADIDTGAPVDCLPELVERLARVRLTDLAGGIDRTLATRHAPASSRVALGA